MSTVQYYDTEFKIPYNSQDTLALFFIRDNQGRPVGYVRMDDHMNMHVVKTIGGTRGLDSNAIIIGLREARNFIRNHEAFIIAKDPLEMFDLWKKGFVNAICVVGDSPTPEELELLKRYSQEKPIMPNHIFG